MSYPRGIQPRLEHDLPERYGRLYDPVSQKFDTPLDQNGFADIDALCDLAIRTYPFDLPDFRYKDCDIHHVYWTEADWNNHAAHSNSRDSTTIIEFRSSTPQLALVPRWLHWWIEQSQVAPPKPAIEQMRQRNNAWKAAKMLLDSFNNLEMARGDYSENKNGTIATLSHIHGETPRSRRPHDGPPKVILRPMEPYLKSELQHRVLGWQTAIAIARDRATPNEFVPRFSERHVAALKRRTGRNATLPTPIEVLAS